VDVATPDRHYFLVTGRPGWQNAAGCHCSRGEHLGASYPTTSISLLERLRGSDPEAAWSRFVHLYTPLLLARARRRYGLGVADAEDVVSDVFVELIRRLPEFSYDSGRSFRGWLGKVLHSKHVDRLRRKGLRVPNGAAGLSGVAGEADADPLEAEEGQILARRALQLMQAEFEPTTWKACWAMVAEGKSATEVAAELGISENAVYISKSRVLRRLRREMAGML
jgi:RNA polymerase sigma factor (sigma-70 family)